MSRGVPAGLGRPTRGAGTRRGPGEDPARSGAETPPQLPARPPRPRTPTRRSPVPTLPRSPRPGGPGGRGKSEPGTARPPPWGGERGGGGRGEHSGGRRDRRFRAAPGMPGQLRVRSPQPSYINAGPGAAQTPQGGPRVHRGPRCVFSRNLHSTAGPATYQNSGAPRPCVVRWPTLQPSSPRPGTQVDFSFRSRGFQAVSMSALHSKCAQNQRLLGACSHLQSLLLGPLPAPSVPPIGTLPLRGKAQRVPGAQTPATA
ncbi:translation initiation factor IF-2 [Symphalangus syndactylus]|uniref:translation initiation factor IF-2 n=1 Tax=Symphalangus syndactylus TaxID=9590 RepID=UPI002442DB3E|nr:translation initiation factor IF-2-like [Symphalangus syndactylus]